MTTITVSFLRRQLARCKNVSISITKHGEKTSCESYKTLPVTVRNPQYRRKKSEKS